MPFVLIALVLLVTGLIGGLPAVLWLVGGVIAFAIACAVIFGLWLLGQFSAKKRRRARYERRDAAQILDQIEREWEEQDEANKRRAASRQREAEEARRGNQF